MRRLVKIALVFAVLLLVMAGCSGKKKADSLKIEEKVVPVKITFPKVGNVEKSLTFTGTLEGIDDAYIFADLPGRFIKYLKPEGSEVKKDEAIALLERQVPGLEFKPVPVKSTLDGILSHMDLSPGELVAPQVPIARVAKIDRLKINFTVPERYAENVKPNQVVRIVNPEDVRDTLSGTVSWVASFLDPVSHTRDARVIVQNISHKLRPGMFVRMSLVIDRAESVLTVPYSSVIFNDTSYVFVASGGIARQKPILVGTTDWKVYEIKAGLKETDSVLIIGQGIVEDGQKIEIITEGAR